MFDINHTITSLSEVESFARFLYEDVKVAFHPDESFENYVTLGSRNHTFSQLEANILDLRMDEAFDVCEKENVDIYEFMMQFSTIHS